MRVVVLGVPRSHAQQTPTVIGMGVVAIRKFHQDKVAVAVQTMTAQMDKVAQLATALVNLIIPATPIVVEVEEIQRHRRVEEAGEGASVLLDHVNQILKDAGVTARSHVLSAIPMVTAGNLPYKEREEHVIPTMLKTVKVVLLLASSIQAKMLNTAVFRVDK
jgi:hypothetical protein